MPRSKGRARYLKHVGNSVVLALALGMNLCSVAAAENGAEPPTVFQRADGTWQELGSWEAYGTLLGAQLDGETALVEAVIDAFVGVAERDGPNPTGTPQGDRSRVPPPLYLMVELSSTLEQATQRRRLQALRTEHAFWMRDERVAHLPEGRVLNRYRETPDTVPVDLNSLLYGLERSIATQCRGAGNRACAARYTAFADQRREAMRAYLWNAPAGRYLDWEFATRDSGGSRGEAGRMTLSPLFTGVASTLEATAIAGAVERELLATGEAQSAAVGEATATAPAMNPPALTAWIAVSGLRRYGYTALAEQLAKRYLATVPLALASSNAAHPMPEGFSAANGVARALLELLPPPAQSPSTPSN